MQCILIILVWDLLFWIVISVYIAYCSDWKEQSITIKISRKYILGINRVKTFNVLTLKTKFNLNPEKVKLKVLFLLKMILIWMLCRGVPDFEQVIQHVTCCCWQIPYLPEVTFDTSRQTHICSLQWSWNVILWTSDITERLICPQILFFFIFSNS